MKVGCVLLGVWSLLSGEIEASVSKPSETLDKAYFYVAEGSKKCFIENTPQSLPITANYFSYENPGVTCSVTVLNPAGREVAKREVTTTASSGRLTYLTELPGQHSICIACPTSKWFGTSMVKWRVAVDLGDTEINLEAAAKGYSLQDNEQILRSLKQKINFVQKEAVYREAHEVALHQSTELLGDRVFWCGLLQMLVIACTSAFSLVHLRRHFKAQKLVN